jgi:hypothetical protein
MTSPSAMRDPGVQLGRQGQFHGAVGAYRQAIDRAPVGPLPRPRTTWGTCSRMPVTSVRPVRPTGSRWLRTLLEPKIMEGPLWQQQSHR